MISTFERFGSSLPFFWGVATAVVIWRRATEALTREDFLEPVTGLNPTKTVVYGGHDNGMSDVRDGNLKKDSDIS